MNLHILGFGVVKKWRKYHHCSFVDLNIFQKQFVFVPIQLRKDFQNSNYGNNKI